jgi:hypothetical protein
LFFKTGFALPPEWDELLGTFSGRVNPVLGVGKFRRKKNFLFFSGKKILFFFYFSFIFFTKKNKKKIKKIP